SRECRQAAQRSHDQGQPLAATGAGASGLGSQSHQGHLPGSAIPAAGEAAWAKEGLDRGGPYLAGDYLQRVAEADVVHGVGGGLLGPAGAGATDAATGQTLGEPRP